VRVSLDEQTSPGILRGLGEGAADVGVLWDLAELSGLHARPYRTDRLCVAMATTHPLARRPSLRFEDTFGHACVNVAPGGQMDLLLRRQAALLGRLPDYRIQVSSMDAACRIIAAGLGLAILPREVVVPHAGAGRLALVPLQEPWALRRFVVVTRAAPMLSATARLLAEGLAAASEQD
jgi:DNA-binding transcriptional LysR family regulator